jgi:Uma2 family endonuclease
MTKLISEPEPAADWSEPEQLLDTLDLPLGYKAEFVEGTIIIRPTTAGGRLAVKMSFTRQFFRHGWDGVMVGLATPTGKFVPDLTVIAPSYWDDDPGKGWLPPDRIALVMDVTSADVIVDRELRRQGFAAAGIPLYLLIDRERKETVLFGAPADDDYTVADWRPLSEPIPLPEPFSFTLEGFTT